MNDDAKPPRPIPESYWLVPDRLLAGHYPFAPRDAGGREKLRTLLQSGVDAFVDLTEDGELCPYAQALAQESPERHVRHRRWPIRDVSVAEAPHLNAILDTIDRWMAQGRRVYFHCFGGIGRTGMVAGCHMVRHGISGEEALQTIKRLRRGTPRGRRASPETEEQSVVVRDWAANDALIARRAQLSEQADRFHGCILGGAVGDALGAPVEFKSLSAIREAFGPNGIQELAPAYGRLGAITDDTQMTLFTLEGLIRAYARGAERGVCDPTSVVHGAYLRWLKTQGQRSTHQNFPGCHDGWLCGVSALHSRRAPGNTCLSALRGARQGDMDEPLNDSKGCGGVMRVAPVGLVGAQLAGDPFRFGCEVAALTHGHPSGYLASGYFAELVHHVVEGQTLTHAADVALEKLREWPTHDEVSAAVEAALALAARSPGTAEDLATLGEGWIAEEALAMSLFCALVARDFEHGVRLAVNHDGDTDSTGAITGNILGALWGRRAIPERWLEHVELRPEMERLVDDCLQIVVGGETGDGAEGWGRYPGW